MTNGIRWVVVVAGLLATAAPSEAGRMRNPISEGGRRIYVEEDAPKVKVIGKVTRVDDLRNTMIVASEGKSIQLNIAELGALPLPNQLVEVTYAVGRGGGKVALRVVPVTKQ